MADYRCCRTSSLIIRYEHAAPGDMLHIDIKKLGRIERPSHRVTGNRRDKVEGAGWEFVFVAIDDHARVAFTDLLPDERKQSAVMHGALSGERHRPFACRKQAASGGIGQILVQMAKRLGAKVYATASAEAKRQIAHARGADRFFAYGNGAFADAVRRSNGGNGVDVVFDSVGKDTLRDSFRATRTQGLVVNYGNVSGSVMDLDPYELCEAGSLVLTRPRLADHMRDAATVQRRADDVFSDILDGTLQLEIAGQHAFADIAIGLERIESRQQVRKAVAWI